MYKLVAPDRRVPLQQATVKRLNPFVSLAATMRHLFICTLLCILPIPVLAQTTRSLPQPRQAKGSDLSTSSALVRDWANRLMANDPKVRAIAEAALVQGAGRSLPLLRRLLDRGNEDLQLRTFDIIRRIGPPAIPLLVDLLRHERVSIRRNAVDALIDLAPYTESIQPALRRALRDEDSDVAGDAARALGALGKKASPSVRALVKALSHEDPYVRIYAAEALASIGPKAGAATEDLARAVGDPIPGVRWAACEALASIGPAAQSAVPQLIEALTDEFLYVRIFAAGALGSIGPKAQTAREALREAANDPALRDEAEWALNRIAGVESGEPVASPSCPRLPSRHNPRRPWLKRAILRLTGTRPPGGTSSGASSWETTRSAVPWLPAMRSMWVPTTPGK